MALVEALDLFCGAGGLSLGLGAAGISVVAGVERDEDAAATWANEHPGALVHQGDVDQVDWRRFDGVALVVGGPPCQPWSIGGLRQGEGDLRDGWPAFIGAVRCLRPRAFLAENVAGLTEGVMRTRWVRLVGDLVDLGYNVSAQVVNAADYGVPQKRRRCIVVGFRDRGTFVFPGATHGPGRRQAWKTAGSVVGPEPWGEPNRAIVTYAARPDIRRGPYAGHVFNGGGRPIDIHVPAPTLLASMGGNKTPWLDTEGIVPHYHAHLLAGGEPGAGSTAYHGRGSCPSPDVPARYEVRRQAVKSLPPDRQRRAALSGRSHGTGSAAPNGRSGGRGARGIGPRRRGCRQWASPTTSRSLTRRPVRRIARR